MEFRFDDDQLQVAALAAEVLTDRAEVERVRAVEQDEAGFDRELWRTLGDTGLLGVALPESVGGSGLGMLGLVALLEQQGRRVAPVPLWSAVATAGFPIAEFGSAGQQQRWLPGLLDGTHVLTGGFEQAADGSEPVRGTRSGDRIRLSGRLASVPGGGVAVAVVVPVDLGGDEVVLAVVPTDHPGVRITPVDATDRVNAAAVDLDGVELGPDDVLAGAGPSAAEWTRTRGRVALAALMVGVGEEALRMTAAYTSQRHQFGRPLSTNQAVPLRAADAHLDVEAIRLTTRRAAWDLDRGAEHEGRVAALVAKLWAARGGLRIVHATQHLHGGLGADVDYPIHRYFLWGRQVAFTLGSAAAVQARLGDLLETAPPIGAPA